MIMFKRALTILAWCLLIAYPLYVILAFSWGVCIYYMTWAIVTYTKRVFRVANKKRFKKQNKNAIVTSGEVDIYV